MIPLFTDEDRYTTAAIDLDTELQQVMLPIMERYANVGYSMRNIQLIASLAAGDIANMYILWGRAPKDVGTKSAD